ncbi:MAG TPA: hypothetical protein VJU58_11070 [Microbacterium sp.]|nr:hypothetical protein [Microbacterium sp.]
MDAATLDELRTLRARAYGPSADIEDDPAALQRLHELEARRAQPAATLPEEPAVADAAEMTPSTAGQPPQPDVLLSDGGGEALISEATSEDEDAPAAGVGRRRKARRRPSSGLVALWVLSVLGAAALAAGLTFSLTTVSPVSAASGVPQIDTLEPDPFIELPAGWFGAGPSSLAFEYYGLTLFETPGGYGGVGTDCFSVVPTEQLPEPGADVNNWSMSGMYYTGCRVGAFPSTVEFILDSAAPQQLRDRFPSGTAVQFVFDGDRIGVFLDSSGAD